MEEELRDAGMSLEDVWADLKQVVPTEEMPEPVFDDDRSWFTLADYQRRYRISREIAKTQLADWVDRGILKAQTQRRGAHNVRCYKPVKEEDNGK